MCEWLPGLVHRKSDDAAGWAAFEQEVYGQFEWDFVKSKPTLDGKPVFIELPKEEGKERTFWHLVTRDYDQTGLREIEPGRGERIAWVRAILEHAGSPEVRVWDNERKGGKKRRILWLFGEDHVVVLNHGNTAWWLVTAYPVTESHTRNKLEKEWEASKNG